MEQQELSVTDVSMGQFTELCTKAFKLHSYIKSEEERLKKEGAELEKYRLQIMAVMNELEMTNFQVGDLGKIIIKNKFSVKVPTGDARKALFDYLKARNEFDALITINANTLNSNYKIWQDEAVKAGVDPMDFKVPGIDEAKFYQSVSFNK